MPLTGRTLIATDAPLVAALIGLLVETSGGQPIYPAQDEPLGEALTRLRPVSLVLVDVAISEAQSDLFFALAERHGVRVVVFGSSKQIREIASVASQRGIAWFSLPPTQHGIDAAIQLNQNRRAESSDDRRQGAGSSISEDGTPILVDQLGTQWLVYDRRVSMVRRQGPEDAVSGIDRTFVSERGERFSCVVDSSVAADSTAVTLSDQLEHARSTAP